LGFGYNTGRLRERLSVAIFLASRHPLDLSPGEILIWDQARSAIDENRSSIEEIFSPLALMNCQPKSA
jgi:hypothetical protein